MDSFTSKKIFIPTKKWCLFSQFTWFFWLKLIKLTKLVIIILLKKSYYGFNFMPQLSIKRLKVLKKCYGCNFLTWKCFGRNLVHSNFIFMINLQLRFKWSHFVTTLITILCITIVANDHNHIYNYNMTNPNFSCTCNNNLWLS
jgi:hypothetical protein